MLLFGSCAYKPQLTTIPLMEKKGDLQIDASISPATLSFSASGSYAFTDHIAAQLFGDFSTVMMYGEGAVGFFNGFRNHIVVEGYLGFGGGSFIYNTESDSIHYEGNHYLGFTQFNIGKRINNRRLHLDFGGGVKIGYLFHNMSITDIEPNSNRVTTYHQINSTVIEPNIVFRIGGKQLKFSIQGNYSLFHQWNHREKLIHGKKLLYACPFNIGLGVSFRIPTK